MANQLVLVIVLLPTLLLGSVLDGRVLWFHSHGASEGHLHIAPAPTDHHDHEGLRDWHHDRHHGQRHDHDRSPTPAPDGLRIELADVSVTAQIDVGLAAATRGFISVYFCAPRWQLAGVDTTHRPEVCRSGWPPQRAQVSGVTALMRSSHALLL